VLARQPEVERAAAPYGLLGAMPFGTRNRAIDTPVTPLGRSVIARLGGNTCGPAARVLDRVS
jgi:hypothetical protein